LREQRSVRERESQEKREFDADLLGRMKAKEDAEKVKQRELKNKIYQQKQMNDQQLAEAKRRKETEAQAQRVKEIQFVSQLKQELNEEKEAKQLKRHNEREQAQRVIQENETAKIKQLAEKERERAAENKVIEDYNRMLEAQEAKRAAEWKAREAKIQLFMNKMADTVQKSNEAEREVERRAVQYQLEKEARDKLREDIKKENAKKKLSDIRKTLEN
jgi:colicin import membrane protein